MVECSTAPSPLYIRGYVDRKLSRKKNYLLLEKHTKGTEVELGFGFPSRSNYFPMRLRMYQILYGVVPLNVYTVQKRNVHYI
jgi:hypothetical protein